MEGITETKVIQIGPEAGLLVLGLAVAFFVLFALVAQHFDFGFATSADKLPFLPYLKFAYVSFIKPHTGRTDGGQQSALESFYSAQVRCDYQQNDEISP